MKALIKAVLNPIVARAGVVATGYLVAMGVPKDQVDLIVGGVTALVWVIIEMILKLTRTK